MVKKGTDLNAQVVGAILNSDPVERDLMVRLERVKAAFPDDGLELSTQKGRTRIQASAMTTTRRAALLESRTRALTRAATAASGDTGRK